MAIGLGDVDRARRKRKKYRKKEILSPVLPSPASPAPDFESEFESESELELGSGSELESIQDQADALLKKSLRPWESFGEGDINIRTEAARQAIRQAHKIVEKNNATISSFKKKNSILISSSSSSEEEESVPQPSSNHPFFIEDQDLVVDSYRLGKIMRVMDFLKRIIKY